MKILEELWYGNICPNERKVEADSEYGVALRKLVEEQSKLSPEVQQTIQKYVDAQMEAAILAERDSFITGFRLAVRLMAAGLENSL